MSNVENQVPIYGSVLVLCQNNEKARSEAERCLKDIHGFDQNIDVPDVVTPFEQDLESTKDLIRALGGKALAEVKSGKPRKTLAIWGGDGTIRALQAGLIEVGEEEGGQALVDSMQTLSLGGGNGNNLASSQRPGEVAIPALWALKHSNCLIEAHGIRIKGTRINEEDEAVAFKDYAFSCVGTGATAEAAELLASTSYREGNPKTRDLILAIKTLSNKFGFRIADIRDGQILEETERELSELLFAVTPRLAKAFKLPHELGQEGIFRTEAEASTAARILKTLELLTGRVDGKVSTDTYRCRLITDVRMTLDGDPPFRLAPDTDLEIEPTGRYFMRAHRKPEQQKNNRKPRNHSALKTARSAISDVFGRTSFDQTARYLGSDWL